MLNVQTAASHTILASWVGAIASAVEQEGFGWADLWRGAAIGDPRSSPSGARLPHDIMRLIWDRAAHLTQEWLDLRRELSAGLPERAGASARLQHVVAVPRR